MAKQDVEYTKASLSVGVQILTWQDNVMQSQRGAQVDQPQQMLL